MNREILLLVFPLLSALAIPALSSFLKGSGFARALTILAAAAGTAYGVFLFPGVLAASRSVVVGNWLPPFGINLFVSPFSLGIVILMYAAATAILVSGARNPDQEKPAYFLLYSLFIMAAAGMVLSGDLFNVFVFLEISGMASFAMIASGKSRSGSAGGLKYLIQAQMSGLAMLAGVSLAYSASGNLNIAALGASALYNPAFAFLTAALILLPFLLEGKIFPFNGWVGDAYEGAGFSVGASLSGIAAAAGAAVMARLVFTLLRSPAPFGQAGASVAGILIVLGGATVVLGEAGAFREASIKKVLGFSSVGQMGMILVGIGVGGAKATVGVLFLLANHTVAKVLLFMIAGFFARSTGKTGWEDMKGVGRRYPVLGGLFILASMALLGLPLFAGFWGKLGLLEEAFSSGGLALVGAVGILIGTILEGVYFMKIGHALFEKGERELVLKTDAALAIPAAVLALALLAVGLFPSLLQVWTDGAVRELLSPIAEYGRIILEGGAL